MKKGRTRHTADGTSQFGGSTIRLSHMPRERTQHQDGRSFFSYGHEDRPLVRCACLACSRGVACEWCIGAPLASADHACYCSKRITYVPGLLGDFFPTHMQRAQSESSLRNARGEQFKSVRAFIPPPSPRLAHACGRQNADAHRSRVSASLFRRNLRTCIVGGSRRVQRRGSCKYMHGAFHPIFC